MHEQTIMYLLQTAEFIVGSCFVFGEQYTVPGRPLLCLVPAHQDEVEDVIPGTQCALAAPDVLNKVTQVALLKRSAFSQHHALW